MTMEPTPTPSCPRGRDTWGDHDRDRPFGQFAAALNAGPVHDVTLVDGHRAFLVLGYHAAREALTHPHLSKDMHAAMKADGSVVAEGLPGPQFARHMLTVDPPDHTRLRRLVAPALTRTRVRALEPRIGQITDRLLDEMSEHADRPVDLVSRFAGPLPFAVLGELLGVARADQRRLAGWFDTLFAPTPDGIPAEAAVEASASIVSFLEQLVDQRTHVVAAGAPGDEPADLVSDLVRAERQGEVNRQELLSSLFQIVVAGHDTTTSLLGNGLAALLSNPAQRDLLVADPDLVPSAVEEFLRWDAPVPHATFRYATRDVTIAGTRIDAGVQVLVNLAAAGRDPSRVADPDTLSVTRETTPHLAFGHGVHHCLGARLARSEADIAFRAILARYPRMRLAVSSEDLHWGHGDGLVLRGLTSLPVWLHGA